MNLKSFENSLIGGVHTFIRKKPCSIIFEHTLNVIRGHTLNVILGLVSRIHTGHLSNVILGFIPRINSGYLSNVILGFIPRIHAEHTSMDTRDKPEYDNKKRMCLKPENDHKRSFIKGLNVVRQCAALLERRVQSGTRVRKAQAVTRQTNPIGRSMIEMLGVLAIIGVLSVGGIAGYSKAMMKFKINKTAKQITEIVTNIRILYMHQDDFNGLNNITAIQMGAVPDDLKLNGSSITNTFGGNINIYGNGYDQDKSFFINLSGLPKEACVALATADWGTTSSSGLVGMVVIAYSMGMGYVVDGCDSEGEIGLGGYYYYACSGHLPLAPSLAAKYCNHWGSDSTYIEFAFK